MYVVLFNWASFEYSLESSSVWLLEVESRDFSEAEKERTAYTAEQIHKMITIFTKNGPRLSF